MQTKETVITKAYDLLRSSTPLINKLPRSFKFTLGDRLHNHLSDLLELLIEAYYAPKSEKNNILLKVNIKLEILRYFFRLGFDLGLYSNHFGTIAKQLDEIGRMTGGWIKSLQQKN